MYPQGTIHTQYSGEYYIAVPIGASTAAGVPKTAPRSVAITASGSIRSNPMAIPYWQGDEADPKTLKGPIVLLGEGVTHAVVANTEPAVDPTTKGSTPVSPAQFEEMTGRKLAVHRNWWFWAALGGGVAALGGGVFYVSRKRAGRRTRSR